jgi:N-acetylmuramoyl-L-alanine amidase
MYKPLVFMVHRTAGHTTNQQLLNYWNQTCQSSHYGINWTGDQHDIWQFVELQNGAGANCCPEAGCHPFFARRGGNANTYTISVEVCTPNTANQGLMEKGQEEALVYLIQTVCKELGIPTNYYSTYWNGYEDSYTFIDTNAGGVGMHRDTNPRNKKMCPGDPYYQNQMKRIMDAVKGGGTIDDRRKYVDGITDKNGWIIRLWESFYQRLNQTIVAQGGKAIPIPKRDTGIFTAWRAEALAGRDLGGVMSEEWNYEGKMFQDFTAGQIYWYGGKATIMYAGK